MELTVGPEEAGNLLVETFDLSVGLRMGAGGETHVDLEHLKEGSPDTGRELRTSVRDDVFGQALKLEYQITKMFSGLQGRGKFTEGYEAAGLGEAVDDGEDSSVSV